MTTIPVGNGNELVEERVFMGERNCMNKTVRGGNWLVCEDEKVYLARVQETPDS